MPVGGAAGHPLLALEKLLEMRFHMARSAHGQREVVRLRPDLAEPYASDPEMRAMRETAGYSNDGSMAADLLHLADLLDNIVVGLDRASAYFWAMTELLLEAATRMPHYTFTQSSFPTPGGFVWHASPHSIDRILPEGELSSDDQANLFHEPLPLQVWGWRRDAKEGPDSVECLSWRYNRGNTRDSDEWVLHRNFHVRYGQRLDTLSSPVAATGRPSARSSPPPWRSWSRRWFPAGSTSRVRSPNATSTRSRACRSQTCESWSCAAARCCLLGPTSHGVFSGSTAGSCVPTGGKFRTRPLAPSSRCLCMPT
jgi:hypothetical protein